MESPQWVANEYPLALARLRGGWTRQRASTMVPMPPRGLNSPFTTAHTGLQPSLRLLKPGSRCFPERCPGSDSEEILFQRLQLQTAFPRHVTDGQYTEVGQAGLGADRSQLRVVDLDLVAGKLILQVSIAGNAKFSPALACSSV